MNPSDYGGGTPIVDVWRRDVGLAVGHVEPRPKVDLTAGIDAGFCSRQGRSELSPCQHAQSRARVSRRSALSCPFTRETTFALWLLPAVHDEDARLPDAYNARQRVRSDLVRLGLRTNHAAQQLLDTLPTVKRMGFVWVTLDDGWQTNVGDWALDPKKFPRGDADMKASLTESIRKGFAPSSGDLRSARCPLGTVEGSSRLRIAESRSFPAKGSLVEFLLLCPADRRVVDYHKALVKKILVDWGFDGLKLDGQDMNGVPACYSPAHHHERPEESVRPYRISFARSPKPRKP